jgi:hypothetical protein
MNTNRTACLTALKSDHHEIEPGQKFEVDGFRPEDALGVARLYYAVYGDSFPVDYVYNPAELLLLNQGPDLHQVVGRTPKGDIVGLYALFKNPPGRHIMEGGSWIVHPSYRGTTLAVRLARRIHRNPPERLELDIIFGQCVCNHLITQKLSQNLNSLICALELEPMPPKPDELGGGEEGRVSLLDEFIIIHDRAHKVHAPQQYQDYLSEFYASWGLDRQMVDDHLPGERTVFSLQDFDEADLTRVTFESLGLDFPEKLAGVMSGLSGRHAQQLILPLAAPGCTMAVEAARAAGFFLGGVLPAWFDRDGLLMQKLAKEPNWSHIRLHRQAAKDLLSTIMADRNSLT